MAKMMNNQQTDEKSRLLTMSPTGLAVKNAFTTERFCLYCDDGKADWFIVHLWQKGRAWICSLVSHKQDTIWLVLVISEEIRGAPSRRLFGDSLTGQA